MEKLSPNRAQLFVRSEYTDFIMGSTVALRSPVPIFYDRSTKSYRPAAAYIEDGYNTQILLC